MPRNAGKALTSFVCTLRLTRLRADSVRSYRLPFGLGPKGVKEKTILRVCREAAGSGLLRNIGYRQLKAMLRVSERRFLSFGATDRCSSRVMVDVNRFRRF